MRHERELSEQRAMPWGALLRLVHVHCALDVRCYRRLLWRHCGVSTLEHLYWKQLVPACGHFYLFLLRIVCVPSEFLLNWGDGQLSDCVCGVPQRRDEPLWRGWRYCVCVPR